MALQNFITRLQAIMSENNLSSSELATKLEIPESNITHYLLGRNKPSFEFIYKILVLFPSLNARWLITGEGKMNN